MTRAEVIRLSAYITDHAHMCRCDEPVLNKEHGGYCSAECFDSAAEAAYEADCAAYYGGEMATEVYERRGWK